MDARPLYRLRGAPTGPYDGCVRILNELPLAPNWTTLAGAVETVLEAVGVPLPRHAVMGLSGFAFTFAFVEGREGSPAPASIHAFDGYDLEARLLRTGVRFERFVGGPEARREALEWVAARAERGVPVIAWALRLREWGIVVRCDRETESFAVADLLTPEVGPTVGWEEWPFAGERVDLLAPVECTDPDASTVVREALEDAVRFLEGAVPSVNLAAGAVALEAWAHALAAGHAIDRRGNAYCLAAVHAARSDAARFCEEIAESFPPAAAGLAAAAHALRSEASELSRLVTLFPYPTGGPGALASEGLRRSAAAALRRAADLERAAAAHLRDALSELP